MAEHTKTSRMWASALEHGFHADDYNNLRRIFNTHAVSGDGLSREGLASAFDAVGVNVIKPLQAVLFENCDEDGSGRISFDEFMNSVANLMHGNNEDMLTTIFQLYDKDNSGYIDGEELRAFVEIQNNLASNLFSASYENVQSFGASTRHLLEQAGAISSQHALVDGEERVTRLDLHQFLALMKRRSDMLKAGSVSHRALVCDVLQLTDSVYDHLHGIFERWCDSDNMLDAESLERAMNAMEIDVLHGLTSHLFEMFDKDGSGHIGFEEFAAGVVGLIRGRSEMEKMMLFQLVDADNTGYIEQDELRRLVLIQSKLSGFINGLPPEEIEETVQTILGSFDDVADDRMSYEEFRAFMKARLKSQA